MRKWATFDSFADCLNDLFEVEDGARVLDHRRLGETWYKWSVLRWYKMAGTLEKTPLDLTTLGLDRTIKSCLKDVRILFTEKWSGPSHRNSCQHPKCSAAYSIDRDMKVRRSTCDFKDDYICSGELGSVRVGCPETPALGSFFCGQHHKETAVKLPQKPADPSHKMTTRSKTIKEENRYVVRDVVGSRITPNGDREYHIVWSGSEDKEWLPACQIQPEVIQRYSAESRALRASRRNPPTNLFELSEAEKTDVESITCNTVKAYQKGQRKHRTAGICAAVYNCGIVFGLVELFDSESLSQVYCFLCWLHEHCNLLPQKIAYDDGCHLFKFARNPARIKAPPTPASQFLAESTIVVDRMHFPNHVDKWCKVHMNPDATPDFKDINTEACEQTFAWLSRFKHATRHMNYVRFNLFLFTICDLYNMSKLKRNFTK